LQFSQSPQYNIRFKLGDGALTISNLPDTQAFSRVVVFITGSSGNEYVRKLLNRTEDGSVSLNLQDIEDGKYYIGFYYSTEGNKFASYVFSNEVGFNWQNGSGSFAKSPVLAHNLSVYEAGRRDSAALEYYLTSTDLIQSSAAPIVNLANRITSGLTDDYSKLRAIHNWLSANLWYDTDAIAAGDYQHQDAVSTLTRRRSVCQGYANLVAALLRSVNIPTKVVVGYGIEDFSLGGWTPSLIAGERINHAWNEVFIDGRWVIIDATWNSRNEFSDGQYIRNSGLLSHRFFDPTLEVFSLTHRINAYPEEHIPPPVGTPSPWATELIAKALEAELVPLSLMEEYTQPVTRAEFCALATVLYESVTGIEIEGRMKFNDTNNINVQKMGALGVVGGIGNGNFDPHQKLTREQAAAMLVRLAEAIGTPLPERPAVFADNADISSWAIDSVGQVQAASVMSGMSGNVFAPKQPYTREQSIITMYILYHMTLRSR
jgi:hypothetical protein